MPVVYLLRCHAMEYLVGIVLALSICLATTLVGFDRDRAFYPTLLTVIASYYGLFAVIGGSNQSLLLECFGIGSFFVVSILGFRMNLCGSLAASRCTASLIYFTVT
jgi:hypothetical protein